MRNEFHPAIKTLCILGSCDQGLWREFCDPRVSSVRTHIILNVLIVCAGDESREHSLLVIYDSPRNSDHDYQDADEFECF